MKRRAELTTGVALAVVLLAGCAAPPAEPPSTRAMRELRRAEAKIPLADRATMIEARLFSDFYNEDTGLVATDLRAVGGRMEKGPVHAEQNAHLLAGLAFQFAVTGDPLAQERARRLVAGLDAMDAANGSDGFLPLEVRPERGGMTVINDRFVASSYAQLLQAQAVAWKLFTDPELKAAIRAQALRMLERLRAHDLVAVDDQGRPLPFSDASFSISPLGTGSQLETLLFVHAGCFFASGEPALEEKWTALRRRMEEVYGYGRMSFVLHVRLPFFEVPTVSSSWLNLIKLSALAEITGTSKYRRLLRRLAEDYSAHANPYFIGLELLYGPEPGAARRAELLRIAKTRLETYPLTNTSLELINRGRGVYRLSLPPRWVKNAWALQAAETVPLYDLPGDRYLWKRDLSLLDGNLGDAGDRVYSGVDFFEAYWLLAYAGGARAP